jgi:tetratricopeptide (TPR) repeat protein
MNRKPPPIPKARLDELVSLYSGGALEKALSLATELAESHPEVPYLHNVLGAIQATLAREDQAIASFQRALELEPEYPEVYVNLGDLHRSGGRWKAAAECYRRAVDIKPDYHDARLNLGATLRRLGRSEDAIEHYQTLLEAKPGAAAVHNNLGNALRDIGRVEEAVASFERALQAEPGYIGACVNLGHALADLGRLDAAIACFERALGLNPAHAEAHASLCSLRKILPGDRRVEEMGQLLGRPETSPRDRVHLHFALGKALADLEDVEKSFHHIKAGNHLHRQLSNYRFADDELMFGRIRELFSEATAPQTTGAGEGDSPITPLFILGMPRSGTTLVEQILASHSRVHGAGELETLTRALLPGFLKTTPPADGDAGVIPSDDNIIALRRHYLGDLGALGVSEPVICDKMPMNFLWTGYIVAAFPEARIIHTNRDPVATCWSMYQRYFKSSGYEYAYDMGELARYYKLYLDLMDFWRNRFPGRIYDLDYEALVDDPPGETRRLLAWSGLDWEENCLNFHETRRVVKTASLTQVRQPIFRGSSQAWKKYETQLQPLLEALGTSGKAGAG